MTLLKLTADALTRCRFALSPLAETIGALIALQRRRIDPGQEIWHTRFRADYDDWLTRDPIAAGLLPLLAATKQFPDLVAQPPAAGTHTHIDDELAAVATSSDTQVRATVTASIGESWQPQQTAWLTLDGLAPRIADTLRYGWNHFVAPDWPRRRAILERDITYRTALVGDHGWQHAIDSLRSRRVWSAADTAIRFSNRPIPDREITDEGLIFVPRTTGGGWWTCEQPPRYALVYPARGAATHPGTAESDALAKLLGPGRARVVRELAQPATSSQLAAVLDLSLGTVGAHLSVLRDTSIVTGTRTGKNVVYRLTDRGRQLVTTLSSAG
ncbi:MULTISPECIES: helix-turn-helix transcriptional regulator [unclassified Nocardia]|uniref:ArsR/SmtB family transcription factor n=1 Tax=unclassified Nocardia TaxID=2637762 RepID=UPI001CE3F949|nr:MULTISPECIES: winged helix-turn-helix domain-containing protein [unclassified Nocardia]